LNTKTNEYQLSMNWIEIKDAKWLVVFSFNPSFIIHFNLVFLKEKILVDALQVKFDKYFISWSKRIQKERNTLNNFLVVIKGYSIW